MNCILPSNPAEVICYLCCSRRSPRRRDETRNENLSCIEQRFTAVCEFVRVPTVPTRRVSLCKSTEIIQRDVRPRSQIFQALVPGGCHSSPCLASDEDIFGALGSESERDLIYLPHATSPSVLRVSWFSTGITGLMQRVECQECFVIEDFDGD